MYQSTPPFGGPQITSIREDDSLIAVQQFKTLRHIVEVGDYVDASVGDAIFSIDTHVRLHAKVPLVTLLSMVHFRVELPLYVLGRVRCCNVGDINHRASLEHQSLLTELVVYGLQNAWAQTMLFQQVTWTWGFAKPQNA